MGKASSISALMAFTQGSRQLLCV